jgi:hypothetical protein
MRSVGVADAPSSSLDRTHPDARLGEQQCWITAARGAVNSLALDILSECAQLRLTLEA